MSVTFENILLCHDDISNILLFEYFDDRIVFMLRNTSISIRNKTKYYLIKDINNNDESDKLYNLGMSDLDVSKTINEYYELKEMYCQYEICTSNNIFNSFEIEELNFFINLNNIDIHNIDSVVSVDSNDNFNNYEKATIIVDRMIFKIFKFYGFYNDKFLVLMKDAWKYFKNDLRFIAVLGCFVDLDINLFLVKNGINITLEYNQDHQRYLNDIYHFNIIELTCPFKYYPLKSLTNYTETLTSYANNFNMDISKNVMYIVVKNINIPRDNYYENAYYFDIIDNLDNAKAFKNNIITLEIAIDIAKFLSTRQPINIILNCVEWLIDKFPITDIFEIIGNYGKLSTLKKYNISIEKTMLYSLQKDIITYCVVHHPDYFYNNIRFAHELILQNKKFIGEILQYMDENKINMLNFLSQIVTIDLRIYMQWLKLFSTINDDHIEIIFNNLVSEIESMLDYRPRHSENYDYKDYLVLAENNIIHGGYTFLDYRQIKNPIKFLVDNGYTNVHHLNNL
jgi:hypothetical protein